MARSPSIELGIHRVTEIREEGDVPRWRNAEWTARFDWLVQGTTGRAFRSGGEEFDLGLFGEAPVGRVLGRWRQLVAVTGMRTAIHSRQVHGVRAYEWRDLPPPGTVVVEGYDAHLTRLPAVLLTISIADCVPVFIAAEEARIAAIAHAGWRGTAAGVVEHTLGAVASSAGCLPADLWLHCGPAICGDCYEVGPEVHRAIYPEEGTPAAPAPIDLRAAIGARAIVAGLDPARVTLSTHCTLCGPGNFFSYRAGAAGRQIAFIGVAE